MSPQEKRALFAWLRKKEREANQRGLLSLKNMRASHLAGHYHSLIRFEAKAEAYHSVIDWLRHEPKERALPKAQSKAPHIASLRRASPPARHPRKAPR